MCMKFAVGKFSIPGSLWVRIKGYIKNADVIVEACYRPCSQEGRTVTLMNYSLRN